VNFFNLLKKIFQYAVIQNTGFMYYNNAMKNEGEDCMTYKKVVVPLDGSKLSEIVLPHVEEIAASCHIAEVELVTVTESLRVYAPQSEPLEQYPQKYSLSDQLTGRIYRADSEILLKVPLDVGKMAKSGRDYLLKVAKKLEAKGLNPRINVLVGNVAEELVHFAEEEDADLIIMASHGRSGISHWAIGSVAEKVFRATNIPLLLVKPKPNSKETSSRRKGKSA
jgi:nucleotide-binding universal stress UspA family protein